MHAMLDQVQCDISHPGKLIYWSVIVDATFVRASNLEEDQHLTSTNVLRHQATDAETNSYRNLKRTILS